MRFRFFPVYALLMFVFACRENQVIGPDDISAPDSPLDFGVYAAYDGDIGIDWLQSTSASVKGYNIYRSINDTMNFALRSFTTDNYFIDKGLDYQTTYYYRITAVGNGDMESQPTRIASAVPKNLYSPSSPQYILINGRNWNDTLAISLSWNTPPESDLSGYEIYRDTVESFNIDSAEYIAYSYQNLFVDKYKLKILKNYYYKIVAVDKGELKSKPSQEVSDYILDRPKLISPPNGSTINKLQKFEFITPSREAKFKLVIQNNEYSGSVAEINFTSDALGAEASVDLSSVQLSGYQKYYWRVLAYTGNSDQPNSISNLFSFIYNPD